MDGAQGLAQGFGLSERVIGLLIVGPGTSLPELIASIVQPVPLDLPLNLVVIANVAVTALLVLWVTVLRRHRIGRPLGVSLLAAYGAYLVVSLRG